MAVGHTTGMERRRYSVLEARNMSAKALSRSGRAESKPEQVESKSVTAPHKFGTPELEERRKFVMEGLMPRRWL